jgi:hypothetical protein
MTNLIRFFAMSVALTGLVSSSFTSKPNYAMPSHLSAVASDPGPWGLPIPVCFPGVPICPPQITSGPSF